MLREARRPGTLSALLSTILSLSDDQRVALERELTPLARAAALGDLAADVAHDIANPLFGVLGLVDLLIEDAAAGSEDEDRLRLLRQTALEMKATLEILLEFARSPDGEPAEASLEDAARQALELLRHGVGRSLEVDERYPPGPAIVPCPPGRPCTGGSAPAARDTRDGPDRARGRERVTSDLSVAGRVARRARRDPHRGRP